MDRTPLTSDTSNVQAQHAVVEPDRTPLPDWLLRKVYADAVERYEGALAWVTGLRECFLLDDALQLQSIIHQGREISAVPLTANEDLYLNALAPGVAGHGSHLLPSLKLSSLAIVARILNVGIHRRHTLKKITAPAVGQFVSSFLDLCAAAVAAEQAGRALTSQGITLNLHV